MSPSARAAQFVGQMLKDRQIHAQRAHPRPVLRRRADTGGELPAADVPAPAAPLLGDVLDDAQQRALGQIEDLTRLAALKRLGAGQVGLAALAALRPMLDPLVRG